MNVLLLSPLPPPSGGIARWTERYLAWCNGKIDVSIVNTALIGERVNKVGINKNPFVELKRTLRILYKTNIKLRGNPDVMHLNTSCSKVGIIRDWLCAMMANKYGIPIVVHCHCNIEDQLGDGHIAPFLFHQIVEWSRVVLVLNETSLKYVLNISTKKVKVIPNFVLAEQIVESHVVNEELQRIVYVGNVQFSKGSNDIYALALRLPKKRFIIVGSVADEMKVLEKPDNVVLLGRVEEREVFQQLANADVFLFPSLTEGFSNALLEAMAMGLPCIATDVGSNADMLENNGGSIVAVHDLDGMFDALEKMESKVVRMKMSEWNIQKVKNHYELDNVMNQMMDIYNSL